jgi:hypothetical protein
MYCTVEHHAWRMTLRRGHYFEFWPNHARGTRWRWRWLWPPHRGLWTGCLCLRELCVDSTTKPARQFSLNAQKIRRNFLALPPCSRVRGPPLDFSCYDVPGIPPTPSSTGDTPKLYDWYVQVCSYEPQVTKHEESHCCSSSSLILPWRYVKHY